MNKNKKLIAALFCITPILSTAALVSSCSSWINAKVEKFEFNTRYALINTGIANLASFELYDNEGLLPIANFLDTKGNPYNDVTLACNQDEGNKWFISSSNLNFFWDTKVKVAITVDNMQVFLSQDIVLRVLDKPYDYKIGGMNEWWQADADGSIYGKATAAAAGLEPFKSEAMVVGNSTVAGEVKKLIQKNEFHLRNLGKREIVKRVYINPVAKEGSGVTIATKFFHKANLKNVDYVFIGKGVVAIEEGALAGVNGGGIDKDAGAVTPVSPCTFEFDFEDLDKVTISPDWYRIKATPTDGTEAKIKKVIIPAGQLKEKWQIKLGIDLGLIENKIPVLE